MAIKSVGESANEKCAAIVKRINAIAARTVLLFTDIKSSLLLLGETP